MLRAIVLCLVLASSMVAAAGRAETVRLPPTGNPAFALTLEPGWTVLSDKLGNSQVRAPDKSGFLQYSVINDPSALAMQPAAVVKGVFRVAHVTPEGGAEPGALAGLPGMAFVGTAMSNKAMIDVRMVIVRVNPGHYVILMTAKRRDISAASAAAMAKMVAGTTLVGR